MHSISGYVPPHRRRRWQILEAQKPGEIPVYQAFKFEPMINVNTANALGIESPASLLANADDAID